MATSSNTIDRISMTMATLEDGIKNLTSSDTWRAYLRMQAAFHQYSFSNTMLILAQRPDATKIAGLKTWNRLGRHVTKGEKAIWILAPIAIKQEADSNGTDDETTRKVVAFRPVPVFALEQTSGDELPTPVHQLAGNTAGDLFDRLAAFSTERGCPVTVGLISNNANGYYEPEHHRIVIRNGLAPDQGAKTLAHEIAHSLLHRDLETYREHRGDCELEAESVAYVVLSHFGVDASSYSFGYVSCWQGGGEAAVKALKMCAGRIQATARAIIDGIEGELVFEGAAA